MKTVKVVLANPPVVYSKTGTMDNDFKCKEFVFPGRLWKNRFFRRIFDFCAVHFGLGKGVRYGVRAGSRWPWTIDRPLYNLAPYPFMMGYTASLLRREGYDADIMDAVIDGESNYDRFLRRVERSNPDIVLMECFASTLDVETFAGHPLYLLIGHVHVVESDLRTSILGLIALLKEIGRAHV